MSYILICSKKNTRNNQVNQLKIPKNKKRFQENQNHIIIFKNSLQNHNIGLIFILNGSKKAL